MWYHKHQNLMLSRTLSRLIFMAWMNLYLAVTYVQIISMRKQSKDDVSTIKRSSKSLSELLNTLKRKKDVERSVSGSLDGTRESVRAVSLCIPLFYEFYYGSLVKQVNPPPFLRKLFWYNLILFLLMLAKWFQLLKL